MIVCVLGQNHRLKCSRGIDNCPQSVQELAPVWLLLFPGFCILKLFLTTKVLLLEGLFVFLAMRPNEAEGSLKSVL